MKRTQRNGFVLLVSTCLFWSSACGSAEDSSETERIARMAMSTASIWMMEHHEHEIVEALEKGDLKEALHETEELIGWMDGTPWLPELAGTAEGAATSVRTVAAELGAGDRPAANAAVENMQRKFHHVHHELMELVAGEGEPDAS